MGLDVRFTGKKRSMWRRIKNPVLFFAPEKGWLSMGSEMIDIGSYIIVMNWYIKGSLDARFCYIVRRRI